MSNNEKVLMKGAQFGTAWSGVDEKNLHGVTHKKRNPDEKKREGFSPSSASGREETI